MTILAVANSAGVLAALGKLLCAAFPDDLLRMEPDPLAAAKYSYTNPVDVLLVTPETRPMNGWNLYGFVRQTNPQAILLMLIEPGRDMFDCLWADKVDGLLSLPMSADAIRHAVQNARQGIQSHTQTTLCTLTMSTNSH